MKRTGFRMVRPERFELPAFWFVARRSIQLSYGRISISTTLQQLTARSAFSSTATFGYSKRELGDPLVPHFRFRSSAVNLVKRFPEVSGLEGVAASAVSFTFLIAPGGKGIRMSCPAAN